MIGWNLGVDTDRRQLRGPKNLQILNRGWKAQRKRRLWKCGTLAALIKSPNCSRSSMDDWSFQCIVQLVQVVQLVKLVQVITLQPTLSGQWWALFATGPEDVRSTNSCLFSLQVREILRAKLRHLDWGYVTWRKNCSFRIARLAPQQWCRYNQTNFCPFSQHLSRDS